jgi:hypothetical protein
MECRNGCSIGSRRHLRFRRPGKQASTRTIHDTRARPQSGARPSSTASRLVVNLAWARELLYRAVTPHAFRFHSHLGSRSLVQRGAAPALGLCEETASCRSEGLDDELADEGKSPPRLGILEGRGMNGISWNRIVGAAERGLVAVPGELAGYLVLAVAEGLCGQSGRVENDDIRLVEDGRVVLLRLIPCERQLSDRSLRSLLSELLNVSTSRTAALVRVACPTAGGSTSTFVTELQTALIPVNRAAAQRAMARLCRALGRIAPPMSDDALRHRAQPLDGVIEQEVEVEVEEDSVRLEAPNPGAGRVLGEESDEPAVREESYRVLPTVTCDPASRPVLAESGNPLGGAKSSPVQGLGDRAGGFRVTLEIPDLEVIGATSKRGAAMAQMPGHCDEKSATSDGSPQVIGEPERVAGAVCAIAEQERVRETTLVMTQMATKPRIERTERLVVGARVTESGPHPTPHVKESQVIAACEPTWPFPLLTRRRSAPEQPAVEASYLPEPAAVEASYLPEQPAVEASYSPEQPAVEVSDFPEEPGVEISVEPASWEATSVDAIIEISDEEIHYEELASDELRLDVDCSDQGDFEAIVPRALVFEQASAFGSAFVRSGGGVTVPARLRAEPLAASNVIDGCEQADGDVDFAALRAADGEIVGALDDGGEQSRDSGGPSSERLIGNEPRTFYRPGGLEDEPAHSTVCGLSRQFSSEPLWNDVELCRSLRVVAGLELSPVAPTVQTRTPPPTVETVARERPEQVEPTRRLRRVGAIVTIAMAMGAGALSIRSANGTVASASRFSVDALGQICRATVTVSGVVPGLGLRIRQSGDSRFREPTTIDHARASFVGLRCGQDAELLVDSSVRVGLRRIPISGTQLQPQWTHLWAEFGLQLDGPS